MSNEKPLRFTLTDNTLVIVKEVANDRYDFEMILPNKSRKTFLWWYNTQNNFEDKKGNIDNRITEAINRFSSFKRD